MTHFDIFCLSNNFLTKTLFVTQELPLFYKKVFFPTQADFSSFICRFLAENIFVFYLKKERIHHDTLCGSFIYFVLFLLY